MSELTTSLPRSAWECLSARSASRLLLPLLSIGLLLLLIAPTSASADQPNAWPDKYVNPKPLDDDLLLPMPCGGAMAFRPVDIPAVSWLDDRRVELGYPDRERAYKEGRRYAYLAGAFEVDGSPARRVYLAKYETTRDQYRAVMDESCPRPNMAGRLPMTELSWFDAVAFTRRYTEWLLANARERLPSADSEPGFLRLPTEEEWEFAVRGGMAVGESDFIAKRFPMPDGELSRYAWHEAADSAQGSLRPVGLLAANPLGLHDMLGNAAEMMFAPFHLDHRGRPHGQLGGFVTRGGDILTPPGQLGSALRQERSYFDRASGRARRDEVVGFRPILTAPVIASAKRLDAIKQAWESLPAVSSAVNAEDAMAALQQLADRSQDPQLRHSLALIQSDLDNAHAAIAEAGERALDALIRMGAYLGKRVVTEYVHAEGVRRLMALGESNVERFVQRVDGKPGAGQAIAEARAALEEKTTRWRAQLGRIEETLLSTRDYYADLVIGVARDWDAAAVYKQLILVTEGLRARRQEGLIAYARVFVGHLKDYRDRREADAEGWQSDLIEIGGEKKPPEEKSP